MELPIGLPAMNSFLRIGSLAQQAGVTTRTVRYYEGRGLIPKGSREGSGQHLYPPQTVARLNKIDELKRLGLSLEEVGAVIDLYFTDPTGKKPKRQVLALLREHLAKTDEQLATLSKFRADLQAHIARFEDWFEEHKNP